MHQGHAIGHLICTVVVGYHTCARGGHAIGHLICTVVVGYHTCARGGHAIGHLICTVVVGYHTCARVSFRNTVNGAKSTTQKMRGAVLYVIVLIDTVCT